MQSPGLLEAAPARCFDEGPRLRSPPAFSSDLHRGTAIGGHPRTTFPKRPAAWRASRARSTGQNRTPSDGRVIDEFCQPARQSLRGFVRHFGAEPKDYFALLKPRVMSLVIFTALAGLLIAPGAMHPFIAAVSLLAIAVGAGASGALNMWYDADIDALMSRTRSRPRPRRPRGAGRERWVSGSCCPVISVMTLGLVANWLSAPCWPSRSSSTAVVYTMWLKRSTPQNIVIGGAAGALPAHRRLCGATNSISLSSIVLFAIIFIWTPPHFWALALVKSGDYAKAGVPHDAERQGSRPHAPRDHALHHPARPPRRRALAAQASHRARPLYGVVAIAAGAGC